MFKRKPKLDPQDKDSIVTHLAFEGLREQKRKRRWGIFFKFLFVGYLLLVGGLYAYQQFPVGVNEHTALVELTGTIGPNAEITADFAARALRDAFENDSAKGVIIRINSPGGSPVQASQINSEIRRLKEKYPDKPVYAVVDDVCASGGYFIAVATDEIYANESSIVGSIGVIMSTFGFTDAMKKLGVERRLLTAGEHKAVLDPFSPLAEDDIEHAQTMLDEIHASFVQAVEDGRGDKLADDEEIFSGLFWTGKRALALGLIDGFGTVSTVAREKIGVENIIDYTPPEKLLDRISKGLGVGMAAALDRRYFSNVLDGQRTPTLR